MTEFHASYVSDSEVELAWEPVHMKDEDEQVDHYEIYFKELKNNSDSGSPFDHESVSNIFQFDPQLVGASSGREKPASSYHRVILP